MKNDALRVLSEDTRKALATLLASQAVDALIKSIKTMDEADSGTFSVVCSTEDRDRQNEIVKQDGWDLSFYKLNPVVLWAHDYSSMPIGITTSIEVVNNQLVASGKFAPTPFAQQIRQLYELGMVKTVSVGFIPKEYDTNDRDVVTRAELLEFSFCPVPANPYALTVNQIKNLKIDMALLSTKGIKIALKEAQAGDACQLDDGTLGILAKDPKNPDGPMVCIPAKAYRKAATDATLDAMKALDSAIQEFKKAHAKAHVDHHQNHMGHVSSLHDAVKDCLKDMSDAEKSAKSHEAIKDAFKGHGEKVQLENQRHSKEMDGHHKAVHTHIQHLMDCVKEMMKMYPSSDETGDDAGANPTADSVRMMKTIKDAFEHITKAHTALKDYAESEGGKKEETVDDPTPPAPKVDPSPANPDQGELEKFLRSKELVKSLNIVLGKVLRAHNRGMIDPE